MRWCLVFLTSFSIMVVVEMQLFGGGPGPALAERPDYRNLFLFAGYRQPLPQSDGDVDYVQLMYEDKTSKPDFTYRMKDDDEPAYEHNRPPFAVPPSSVLYYSNSMTPQPRENRPVLKLPANKKFFPYNFDSSVYDDTFSERRIQRQNPNLAANKFHKIGTSTEQPSGPKIQKLHPFGSVRDIPTSLMPAPIRHNSILKEAMKNHPNRDPTNDIYIYATIASIIAATCVIIAAFGFGWYTIQKKMKAAADTEYPAYGVTGPNTNTSPSGDRRLAHSAQLYHYQHQKQQILAMEKNINERNGSVSDPESDDENEEGDYTVYECPGFATTGELEIKNPMFLDEPTPATPATVVKAEK